MLIDHETQQHSTITEREIDKCLVLNDIYICEHLYPTLNSELTDPCLRLALDRLPANRDSCPISIVITRQTIRIPLHSKHSWIHGSYGATVLRVTCP